MKVPISWLKEFIDLPTTDPEQLAADLSMAGDKVEGYEVLEPDWSDVVVGEVVAIGDHPDADKIRVCQVDVGQGPSQIICGAWNFEVGARVPVAVPGAVLAGGFEIGQRTIRGVESNGMICSEQELGIGEDHTGILVLEGQPEVGTDFGELVELPDIVIELEITPNRPDAMSIVGIARDLAAYYGIEYRVPELAFEPAPGGTEIDVIIEDPIGCRRFTAREIRGVKIGPSPLRVRHRLAKIGVRAISNVVDVTNYVMFELGHPLHSFDADAIAGNRLVVKRAQNGEELITLDEETRQLTSEDLIIYDDDGPTSMSGTMGGARSEVSDATQNVLMEAASWDPPTIMYMSRRHGLRSEASTRFERGVDPNLADRANQRASAMVALLAGGEVLEGSLDVVGTDVAPVAIELHLAEVRRLLGDGFDSDYVSGILRRLDMQVEGEDPLRVVVPTFRPDVTRPADLIEEIARIHGFFRFGSTVPTGSSGGLSTEQKNLRKLQGALAGIGFHQAVTLPFVGEEDLRALGRGDQIESLLRVSNPLSEEEGLLRPSILPSLLNAAKYNFSYGARSVALFETGRAFSTEPWPVDPRLPTQIDRVAWIAVGPLGTTALGRDSLESGAAYSLGVTRNLLELLRVDAVIRPGHVGGLHPGRTAELVVDDVVIGVVGELSPSAIEAFELPYKAAVAEIDLQPLIRAREAVVATTPSFFPHVDFDLSFLVPGDVLVADVLDATRRAAGELLETAKVFDEFRADDMEDRSRAIAIRYRLRSPERTMTNDEVAPVRESMIEAASGVGAELRGA